MDTPRAAPPTTPTRPRIRPVHVERSPGTPRRRKHVKKAPPAALPQNRDLDYAGTLSAVKAALKLNFEPDKWQIETIMRVRQGHDSICVAGTGYGKSLVFHGLAALGGKGRVTLVICPLKALEIDQVDGARAKGINALAINEDNSDDPDVWKRAKTAQLIYVSPEMAVGDGFTKMWRDVRFRSRLQAVIIDEAHCVDEWGLDFRPLYRELYRLRHYTGQDIPFLACTATCTTNTFNTLWTALGFGHRDFSGVDVGCDRDNLLFIIRPFTDPKNLIYDILNVLPADIGSSTPLSALPKTLIYFDSEAACRRAVQDLRKCLPEHLRDAVKPFSSDLSEEGKAACWDGFKTGTKYRILCATDAAGMGCDVPDVENVIIVGCPKSLSAVMQRWGRAGRSRSVLGTCLLLVPKWAYRPAPPEVGLAVQRVKGKAKVKVEPKKHAEQRGRLQPELEKLINLANDEPDPCSHRFLADVFRPETRLTTRAGFGGPTVPGVSSRSLGSAYTLEHTVADLARHPREPARCCDHHSRLAANIPLAPAARSDPRLSAYAHEFVQPLAVPASRPGSSASNCSQLSHDSQTSHDDIGFVPLEGKLAVPAIERERLRTLLEDWRDTCDFGDVDLRFVSRRVYFPDRALKKFVDECHRFLKESTITPALLRKVVSWDSADDVQLNSISVLISSWRIDAAARATPRSGRQKKKKRSDITLPLPPQPQFIPRASHLPTSHPLVQSTADSVFGTSPSAHHTPRASTSSSRGVGGVLRKARPQTPPPRAGPSRISQSSTPAPMIAPSFRYPQFVSPFSQSGVFAYGSPAPQVLPSYPLHYNPVHPTDPYPTPHRDGR